MKKGEECHGKHTNSFKTACRCTHVQQSWQQATRVEKGTLIATPTGLGANIFSSVYGVVEEVLEDRIVIKPDEEQKEEFIRSQKEASLIW